MQMPQNPLQKAGRLLSELLNTHKEKFKFVGASHSPSPLPCLAGWRGDMPWREARDDFFPPPHFERIFSRRSCTPRLSRRDPRKTRARERRCCTCPRRLCRHLAESPAGKQRSDRHREEAPKEKPYAQGLHQQAERRKDPGAQPHPSTPARPGR